MEDDKLHRIEKPVLARPYLITGFSGWADAGKVASSALLYILSRLEMTLFAELKPDDFYVCLNSSNESNRPLVDIVDGLILSLNPVTLNFWGFKAPPGGRDLILVSGPEPEQRWEKAADLILDLAREYDVAGIYLLGGSFDAIPHTVPVRIKGVANCSSEKATLIKHHIEPVNYKGPSSLHSLIMLQANRHDIPAISLWAHTPHYIQVVNFIGCYHLLMKLNELVGFTIDLETAKKDNEELRSQIDQAIARKPELRDYLKILETEYNKNQETAKEPISPNIFDEIENLLKDNPA